MLSSEIGIASSIGVSGESLRKSRAFGFAFSYPDNIMIARRSVDLPALFSPMKTLNLPKGPMICGSIDEKQRRPETPIIDSRGSLIANSSGVFLRSLCEEMQGRLPRRSTLDFQSPEPYFVLPCRRALNQVAWN
jgi:hypothetical protein